MSTLRVGIVGYGKVGAGAHRKWVTGREDTRPAAVRDAPEVGRDAARAENPDAAIYESYEELLADPAVQLVVVTTPPNSHCNLAVRAAQTGKHVFVDKPFAMIAA